MGNGFESDLDVELAKGLSGTLVLLWNKDCKFNDPRVLFVEWFVLLSYGVLASSGMKCGGVWGEFCEFVSSMRPACVGRR